MKNKAEAVEAVEQLREMLPKGSKVYTVLEHVSSSRTTRYIKVLAVQNGEIQDISYLVRRVRGDKMHDKYGGIKMSGGGMDMGFALVYSLSAALHDDGYALKNTWL